ncbi:hypothetical protein FACS1894122_14800 [Alphaproteobacteria bacterium]|nr:hypothetical protein FACS1894122_14800 [Alphaproteobacteria bacterium]
MTDTQKEQSKKAAEIDSKPAQLAKLIFRGIQRHIKVKNAQDREKNYDKMLDFSRERRVNRECKY